MNKICIVTTLVLLPLTGFCQGSVLQNSFWGSAAFAARVNVATLYGIALKESGMRWPDGSFRPWPWSLNVNKGKGRIKAGPKRYPSKSDAVKALKEMVTAGVRNVDVGLMQVNLLWQGHRVHDDIDLLLEPAANIMVAALYLREIEASDTHKKVSDYHSPSDPVRGNHYANHVKHYERIINATIR
jgi:Transglycosylase SLT domain